MISYHSSGVSCALPSCMDSVPPAVEEGGFDLEASAGGPASRVPGRMGVSPLRVPSMLLEFADSVVCPNGQGNERVQVWGQVQRYQQLLYGG